MRFFFMLIMMLWVFGIAPSVFAEDEPSPVAPPKSVKKKHSGKLSSEKEAEGTEAPNRFEADTVIKSKFQLDGQPLEVDPD